MIIFVQWGQGSELRGATPNFSLPLTHTFDSTGALAGSHRGLIPLTFTKLQSCMFSLKKISSLENRTIWLLELALVLYPTFIGSVLMRLFGITNSGYRRHNDSILAYFPTGNVYCSHHKFNDFYPSTIQHNNLVLRRSPLLIMRHHITTAFPSKYPSQVHRPFAISQQVVTHLH